MPDQTTWSCQCGDVELTIRAGEGTRAVCYCSSCQTFPKLFGHGDLLSTSGGTELYQTLPDLVTINRGADRLGRLRLTDKGPLRWVATCCGTPLANTSPTVQVPFVSILLWGAKDPGKLGPVRAHVNTDSAKGPVPTSLLTYRRLFWQVLGRAFNARLRGRHRPNPFFDPEGKAVGARIEITDEMRASAAG
ncbi:MAG: DUF6151 family protein [Pseudomonadota bacterium]